MNENETWWINKISKYGKLSLGNFIGPNRYIILEK